MQMQIRGDLELNSKECKDLEQALRTVDLDTTHCMVIRGKFQFDFSSIPREFMFLAVFSFCMGLFAASYALTGGLF